jgi:hypothetical protein
MVMSDRHDNGPLRLPPEREVSPKLRARVLHEAMREERKPVRPPTRIGPVFAGLAAAAVVVGVVYVVSQNGDDGHTPATHQDTTGQPVAPHDFVETVGDAVPKDKAADVQGRCNAATGIEAGYRMTTEKLLSPLGRVNVGAYAVKGSKKHTQIFCTPFAVITSLPDDNIVTAQTPVKLIAGSRVQGLLPTRNETADNSGLSVYYDGAWFAVTSGVQQLEVRLVVDGEAQPWHAAKRLHAYLFAATWAQLSDDQMAGDVTVQYRAISVDGTLMPMPEGITSSTVTPAETQHLNDSRGVFPRLAP